MTNDTRKAQKARYEQKRRDKLRESGLAEVRGIWAKPADHAKIKRGAKFLTQKNVELSFAIKEQNK